MLAQRLKELRSEYDMTQVQLAEKLGVSKGTVAMWETGKRKPSFDALEQMSKLFHCRVDYILGISDDMSAPQTAEDASAQQDIWVVDKESHDMMMDYLRLDAFGKAAVEAIITRELHRCLAQDTTVSTEDYQLQIRVKKN